MSINYPETQQKLIAAVEGLRTELGLRSVMLCVMDQQGTCVTSSHVDPEAMLNFLIRASVIFDQWQERQSQAAAQARLAAARPEGRA